MPKKQQGQDIGRVMTVTTRRAGTRFNRAGILFTWEPVTVTERLDDGPDVFDVFGNSAEVSTGTFDRILAEEMLRCEKGKKDR